MTWERAAKQLAGRVTGQAPEWHEAVSSTPRHELVPRWWERVPDSPDEEWELVSPAPLSEEHIAAAYRDETLVTRVGPDHADGAKPGDRAQGSPTSSSTLPGLVVSMAHLLDAHPGEDILDVGTGSGYGLALLSHRFGDRHVTSVDVDAYLVGAARSRLAELGRTPRMEVLDATGRLPEGRYDGILATVSVRPVPESWLRALRPGGGLVTTIAHTALLLRAEMGRDGVARGSVQPNPATFMETRRAADYPPRLQAQYLIARDGEGEAVRCITGAVPDLWQDWPLRWLYELDTPGTEVRSARLPDGRHLVWLLADDGSWARAEAGGEATVHQSGPRRLWDRLEAVQRRWDAAGRFPLHALDVTLTPDGGTLNGPDGWVLRL